MDSLRGSHMIRSLLVSLLFFPLSAFAADKHIGILVFDGVLSSDVTAPAEVFGVASRQAWFKDYQVTLIGIDASPTVTTEEGIRLTVDASITDDIALDALIVPSSYSMEPLINNEALIEFLRTKSRQVSWLGSNCSGAFLLGEASLLNQKSATTWAGGEKDLQKSYPAINVVENKNVVIDGNIITSNGSLVSYQAALIMLAKMSSLNNAKSVFEVLQMQRITPWTDIIDLIEENK